MIKFFLVSYPGLRFGCLTSWSRWPWWRRPAWRNRQDSSRQGWNVSLVDFRWFLLIRKQFRKFVITVDLAKLSLDGLTNVGFERVVVWRCLFWNRDRIDFIPFPWFPSWEFQSGFLIWNLFNKFWLFEATADTLQELLASLLPDRDLGVLPHLLHHSHELGLAICVEVRRNGRAFFDEFGVCGPHHLNHLGIFTNASILLARHWPDSRILFIELSHLLDNFWLEVIQIWITVIVLRFRLVVVLGVCAVALGQIRSE